MNVQLKILVGVAVFATLALAGTFGIFNFGAVQNVQAQTAPSATRSFDMVTVAPGGEVMVTITIADNPVDAGSDLPLPWAVTETLPAGFTTTTGADTNGGRRFISTGTGTIRYTVTVAGSVTEGPHPFSGKLTAKASNADDAPSVTSDVGGASEVTVATDRMGVVTLSSMSPMVGAAITASLTDPDSPDGVTGATWQWSKSMTMGSGYMNIDGATSAMYTPVAADVGYYLMATAMYTDTGGSGKTAMMATTAIVGASPFSVEARPDDPGDPSQITLKFYNPTDLQIDQYITFVVEDDMGVPSTINPNTISITGMGTIAELSQTAQPSGVIVEQDEAAETYEITVFIGDMSTAADEATEDGLAAGKATVVFRQTAGLTNRTEGGSDDWSFFTATTGSSSATTEIGSYNVPWTIDLSSYADPRGEEITVIGKGFKNGTTTTFWIDKNRNGTIDENNPDPRLNETELCDAIADGDDIATCKFTLGNPPFRPGKADNYINAVDGRNLKAGETGRTAELKQIELEPSLSVSPPQGNPGDSINYQLRDFHPGSSVTRIQFARSIYICGDANDSGQGCPGGAVGENGNLSFSFKIPNDIGAGSQDLKVWTRGTGKDADGNDIIVGGDDNITFIVGAGDLQLSSTNVLPNQRISVSASGFTKSANRAPAYIGNPGRENNSCPVNSSGAITSIGSVFLGGEEVPWGRINGGEAIEVTSGGTWSATIDLPVNSSTVVAGNRVLKITDCEGGEASINLTFAERKVTMTPEEGGVGTEVVISGKNFPVRNDDGSDVEVTVTYDATIGKDDDDDVEPDAVGNFTVILEVPEDAGIPSDNTVKVLFHEDDDSQVLDTFTHRVPQGKVSFSTASGAENSILTITANGFARYTSVGLIEFDDRDITPSPKPSTDTNGNGSFDIRIPGSDPGIYIIRVEIEEVVATSTFTVVSGSGAADASVETVLANLISEGALDRIFRFDNTTKTWEWYIADPAFAASNNLAGLSSGDLVFIKVTQDMTVDILGTSIALTCINEGTETEDCWNTITIP